MILELPTYEHDLLQCHDFIITYEVLSTEKTFMTVHERLPVRVEIIVLNHMLN